MRKADLRAKINKSFQKRKKVTVPIDLFDITIISEKNELANDLHSIILTRGKVSYFSESLDPRIQTLQDEHKETFEEAEKIVREQKDQAKF